MKNRIVVALILAAVLLLSACGGSSATSKVKSNPEYDAALQEIAKSTGAYDIYKKYKDNAEAIDYIMRKIPANDVGKLIRDHNELYGYDIYNKSDMGKILKIMSQNGFENYSKDVIIRALNIYIPTTPSYDENALSSLKDLDGDEFYSKAKDLYSGGNAKQDAEDLLLTEAFKRAENKLKKGLKNPSSYQLVSINGSTINYDPKTGEYAAIIMIKYSATNSFGGTVTETYSYGEQGTYKDGRITYKEVK